MLFNGKFSYLNVNKGFSLIEQIFKYATKFVILSGSFGGLVITHFLDKFSSAITFS